MTKLNSVEVLKTKRFVVRKSLIGKNVVFSFTNKKGVNVKYNHDKVYEIMKSKLENLPCFQKYKNMKVKFLKNAKIWIVQRINSQQIVFSHSSKSECYEWIFKTVHYA